MSDGNVTVLEHGKRVSVGPGYPSVKDVLEYAKELIVAHGWNQTPADTASSDTVGYTLHDSIGRACTVLSEIHSDPTGTQGIRGSKDWSLVKRDGKTEQMRTQAQDAVNKALPDGMRDTTFNDQAKKKEEVLEVLDKAIAGVK